jgi:hypothetical protein
MWSDHFVRSIGPPLAVLVGLCLAACGGEDDEPARPAAASVTPFPSIDMADLAAGTTYTTRRFKPSITLTLPEGEWKLFGADSPDHVEIEPTVEDPVDSSALGFHHMTRVFDPKTGGETPGDAVAGPADFARWLADHPHLRTTRPEPVEALGLKGVSIDVRVKSSQPRRYRDCGKVSGDCVVMFIGKIEPIVYGSASFGRFYVLEQPDGKQLVVEQYVEPASAYEAQRPAFESILDSATVR